MVSSGHHVRSVAQHKQVQSAYESEAYDDAARTSSSKAGFVNSVGTGPFCGRFRGTVTGPEERGRRTKKKTKRSANKTRFRPGTTGTCEAQLWSFTGPTILPDDNDSEVRWVAAESLDAALRYMRLRHDDFVITEARFLGMVPLLSGSPLD
jgi:hypothetical protein